MALINHQSETEVILREDLEDRFTLMFDDVDVVKKQEEKVDGQLTYLEVFRDRIVKTAEKLNKDVHDSREKSLALTKLEEALMWSEKAILK
jgi:dihydroxyacetone kinase